MNQISLIASAVSGGQTRCTGHCCRAFTLSHDIEHIKSEAQNYRKMPREELNQYERDVVFVADNFFSLGKSMNYSVCFKKEYRSPDAVDELFSCRQYNHSTGNCMDFKNRPRVCSEYPYGRTCRYEGCTFQYDNEKEITKEKMQ